jgi:peptidylprolyl isomerase
MVKVGDKVNVHYKGTLNDGTLFDSSEGREPLQFEAGSGMVIPGFDNAMIGMAVGDSKTINIPSAEAYGERRDEMVVKVPRKEIPENIPLQVGGMLTMHNGQQEIPVLIAEVTDEEITVDANHTLAGKDLTFEIALVSIEAEAEGGSVVDFTEVTPDK